MVFRQQEQTSSQQDKYIKTWLCGVEDEDKEHGSPDAAPKPSMLDRSHPCPRRPRSEPEQDLNMQKGRQRADATVSKRYVVEEVHEFSKGRRTSMRNAEATPDTLNLQAPFRMGHETLPTGRNRTQRETYRKRPRNSSSDSSLIQPLLHDKTGKPQHIYAKIDGYESDEGSDSFESIVEERHVPPRNLGGASPEHEEQPKTYGRRPRHKTRPDLYEIKLPKGKENKKPGRERKQSRAGRKKRKRGSLGLPKLSSEYVLTERLTMKPSYNLGLFNKGRASAPAYKPGLPDLAFSEMRFLQKPRQLQLSISGNPPAQDKRAESSIPPDELSRFFASAKQTPKREGVISRKRSNADGFSHGTPIQSPLQCLERGSPAPMAPDKPSPRVLEHDYPGTETYRRTPFNADDPPTTAGIMPPELMTPIPNTVSTLPSEPYTWPSSPLPMEQDRSEMGLEDQSYQHPTMLASCVPSAAVPEQQSLRSGLGREFYTPTYAGLYGAGARSGSTRQPNQELSEAPNAMRRFWRPHKLY